MYTCLFNCSPSVLDRLNCLLEPGGYLSIDERGVVGDSVPIVYPHPEFRYSPVYDLKLRYSCILWVGSFLPWTHFMEKCPEL